jgi:uncharacterized protein (DUF2147 family)
MPRFATFLATLALTAAVGATAFAQAPAPSRIRGTIVSFAGGVLTVQGVGTTYKVTLPDNVAVTWITKSSLANIGPNSFIGTVAVPQADGTLKAVEVQLFPEALRGRGEGSRPWDSVPNSSMTNATVDTIASASVDKVEGRVMVVKYQDGEKKVFVPTNVPVITYVPADKAALTPGAHIIIVAATKNEDGSYTTSGVNVGKDGLVPPM